MRPASARSPLRVLLHVPVPWLFVLASQLVTWGPYRFTRNPMCVGLVLAYLEEAGILHHVGPAVVLPLVIAYVNWIVIPLEEAKLSEAFGDRFEGYRARVRRWL
jgi:protein-S-isoprenylcysteine O-methyltransferase Ste14